MRTTSSDQPTRQEPQASGARSFTQEGVRVSALLSPLIVRLVLGLTFAWAGWGKLAATMPVSGADAAALANMGLIAPPKAPVLVPADAPTQLLPVPSGSGAGAGTGTGTGAGGGEVDETRLDELTGPVVAGRFVLEHVVHLVALPALMQPERGPTLGPAMVLPGQYTAAQFPSESRALRLWGIALRVHKAATPPVLGVAKAPASVGNTPALGRVAWPGFLGQGVWPKFQAQAVLAAELVCAGLVLFGLFTRPAALMLSGVMLGAMWLDQIGPQFQVGNVVWGIVPAFDAFDVRAWMPLLWQGALLGLSISLALSGGGGLSLDRALAARRVAMARPMGQLRTGGGGGGGGGGGRGWRV